MLDAEAVGDGPSVCPMKKKNECSDSAVARASTESSLANTAGSVDHVESPAMNSRLSACSFHCGHRDRHQLQRDQRRTRQHQALTPILGSRRETSWCRTVHDRKACDTTPAIESEVRRVRTGTRDEGKQAEHTAALDEDRE